MKDKLKPLWQYNPEDITTWKYLDVNVDKKYSSKPYICWIINPHFKYKHLDKLGYEHNSKMP